MLNWIKNLFAKKQEVVAVEKSSPKSSAAVAGESENVAQTVPEQPKKKRGPKPTTKPVAPKKPRVKREKK